MVSALGAAVTSRLGSSLPTCRIFFSGLADFSWTTQSKLLGPAIPGWGPASCAMVISWPPTDIEVVRE